MAKFNKSTSFYQRQKENDERLGQRKRNLVESSKEKVNVATDWEIANTREEPEERKTPPTFDVKSAPTINPPRPRAKKMGYSRQLSKLIVRFRDGTPWEYNNVPVEMWNDLKASNSTGRYLKYSGLDQHDDMGKFNVAELPDEARVRFES